VVFPDEMFLYTPELTLEEIEQLRSVVVITSSENRYKYLLNNSIKAVFCPFIHWYFHVIPMRKLNLKPYKNYGAKAFNFLNSRWNPGRFHLVEYLFKHHPELLNSGFVTAGRLSYYKDHPKIQKDKEYDGFYQNLMRDAPVENNNYYIQGIPVSSNVKNFVHIANNIPGAISIQVETWSVEESTYAFFTEKSMVGIATQQIPIIISWHPSCVDRWLRAQGFDVFDDIIDQSYDIEPNYIRRCELAIELNIDWLRGEQQIPDLRVRSEYNQNHLIGTWLENSLLRLIDEIETLLS
jgi:hypothetical protein